MRIDKLTPEQEALLPVYRDEWIKIGLSTEPADRPRAERAIALMYEAAGLPPPKQIVWAQSPLSALLVRDVLSKLDRASVWDSVRDSVRDSVWDSVRASVRDSVWASVGASVRASVWASVGTSVRASVRASVWASVWDSVGTSVGDSVGASVWASVWDSVGTSVGDSVGDFVYGAHDAGFLSFYRVLHDFGLVDQTQKMSGLWELAQSAGWALPCNDICIVSERHSVLNRDDQGRLHCETGPAVLYHDGFSVWAWHGTRVPREWIEDRKSLTPEIALKWENVEQRRAACEMLGWESILSKLDARVIDEDGDPEIGTLVEVEIPDIGKERFLRVRCGTGRQFALPVPPEMTTALSAQAWTWGLDKTDFIKPEVRT